MNDAVPVFPGEGAPRRSLFVARRTNGQTGIDALSTWGPLGRGDDGELLVRA